MPAVNGVEKMSVLTMCQAFSFCFIHQDADGMPDLSEGTSRDADGDGVPDFRDPRVNCSHNFPGQQWADIQHASTVHAVP